MKRTKEWWARLTKEERSHLVYLERSANCWSAYLPDDCCECSGCGTPMVGEGLCEACYEAWKYYVDKADGKSNG